MRGAACGLLALWALPAAASGYSEFNAGIATNAIDLCDVSVQHLSAALAAPDLLPDLRPVALLVRGQCFARGGKFDLAETDFREALRLRPDYIDVFIARGYARGRHGDSAGAVADFDAAIALRPELTNGLEGRAYVHLKLKDYGGLVADLSREAALDDGNYEVFASRADAYALAGNLDAAMDDADKVAELLPKSTMGHVLRGTLYTWQERYSRAEQAFDSALRLNPGSTAALFGKGLAEWSDGDFKGAAASFAVVAPRAPTDPYAVLWLSIARHDARIADDDLPTHAAYIDAKTWPGALVELFTAKRTEESAVAAAQDGDSETLPLRLCESAFYAGMWHRMRAETDAAAALLAKATQDCTQDDPEWYAARIALKRDKQ